ncbi:MAG: hypothetical protein ACFCVK_03085 [Acidimicrobiales bacterium]
MRFAVESWDPAYGVSADEAALEPAATPVDAAVEVPLDRWGPVTPDPDLEAVSICFVDGVRRIDTRVWIDEDDLVHPGICATVAAGVVHCETGRAAVGAVLVERGLYTAAGGAESIEAGLAGRYELQKTRGDDDAHLYLGVHDHMTELERAVSDELSGEQLVVFDGPLRGRDAATGVGFIKTQHRQYLESTQQRVVSRLADGQRTPLFSIASGDRFGRWSWYLRLPGPRSHPMSGIVRLELPEMGDAESAAARADVVSAALPRFASEAHKDARAPQNLYPIAGLERQLRRRLGDPHLLERELRVAASRR